MAKIVRTGDVLQVLTSEGVAYAQITHKHEKYGFLIRAFPGFYPKRPRDYTVVVGCDPLFSAFFIAQSAVNQGLLSAVANVSIREDLQVFPTFRSRNGGPGGSLWLWDGNESVRLERDITEEEQRYPLRGIISAPLLVDRFQKSYRAETHDAW